MVDGFKAPEGHVVAAKSPDGANSGFGAALFAVVTDTLEQAESAVRDLVPPGTIIEAAGAPIADKTVERLELVPGEAKQIG